MQNSRNNFTADYPFPPGTQTWRINKEAVLLLGAGRALLMQAAHPMIARALVEHSYFREHPLRRLLHTLSGISRMIFSDKQQARHIARHIRRRHQAISGEIDELIGDFPPGRRYFADNPALQMWVFATLVDTAIIIYERFICPLNDVEKAQYYNESTVWATWLGITRDALPVDYPAFQKYLSEMLESGQIAVGPNGKLIQSFIFRPNLPYVPNWIWAPLRLLTKAFLPKRLQNEYGFRQHLLHKAVCATMIGFIKTVIWICPERWRSIPIAYRIKPAETTSKTVV
jgi:uncharacterized protein (DUF2236 family)